MLAVMAFCASCGSETAPGDQFCRSCGVSLSAVPAAREQRKTVTVVFCDLVGSTRLGESKDPEVVRRILERYFERMKAIVERHGGTVEKFIGDAVVAVFGVPVAHEDDALRALRAAAEMRAALPELGVEARLGVNSGEIVTSGFGTIVTGDAVNVAARLQQAAGSGEVLLGETTRLLARGAVEVEDMESLVLKGKAEPVAAYRLLAVGWASERAHGASFVGRAAELALLRAAWGRVAEGGRCELVTVIGEPGVGKSRLIAELVAGLDARVVMGRCLSYGEGMTYWPVGEVIGQLGTRPADRFVAGVLETLLGDSETETTPEEIAWAFRKLLEQEAPLLVVFDDLQWGEETFLDLVEQVGLLSAAPVLLVCLARPELSARRPEWPVSLRLAPLPVAEVEALLPPELTAGLRERIVRGAGGNPLFATEMVAMAAAAGLEVEVAVPPTLRALLAARLDQLEAAERGVLERGAVEGEVFHRGAVQALGPAETPVAPRLAALVRRELIRPERPLLPGDEGFRFCHLLMRDAAYESLPKATRAELHERFAGWLEQCGGELVERDELVGYHLRQAHRFLQELGAPASETGPLGERAAGFLAAAGRRATVRGDYHSAARMLERALALGIPEPRERLQLQIELGVALLQTGRSGEGETMLEGTVGAATELGERGLAARALVGVSSYRLGAAPEVGAPEMIPVAEAAIATLEALGDRLGLAEAEYMLTDALSRSGRRAEGSAARDRALAHAEAAGAIGLRRRIVNGLASSMCLGPMPAQEGIGRLEELLGTSRDDRVLEAMLRRYLAFASAMVGRFDEAQAHLAASAPVLDELNLTTETWAASRFRVSQTLELLGDDDAAEKDLIAQWQYFRDTRGERISSLALMAAAQLATLYCDQGRWEEAVDFLSYGREVDRSPPPEGKTYAFFRLAARARIAARSGKNADALELARTALELAARIRMPNYEARVWLALAEVQRAAGNQAEADEAVERALELYDRKGNIAAAARVRAGAT
jgi:class 3 adenylate cyclase/tetratricopeptide (TPR) repeat protein